MKKFLAVVIAVVMMTQLFAVAVTAQVMELDKLVEIGIGYSGDEEFDDYLEVETDDEFDLLATVYMSDIKDKFDDEFDAYVAEFKAAYEEEAGESISKEEAEALFVEEFADAKVEGKFTLVLKFHEDIELSEDTIDGEDLDGFANVNEDYFVEVSRELNDDEDEFEIVIEISEDITFADFFDDIDDILGEDFTFLAEEIVCNEEDEFEFEGTIDAKFSIIDEVYGTKSIEFETKEPATAELYVEDETRRPGGGGGASHSGSGIGGSTNVPIKDGDNLITVIPFNDVNKGDWYYEGVQYAHSNNIFKGITDNTFEPNTAITRGMLVTVLGRTEGVVDKVSEVAGFTDVDSKEYYAAHVNWAVNNGIVNGYGDGTFGPNDLITREQLAAIMHRYMEFKGMAAADITIELPFADANQIADYAVSSVKYCYAEEIMNGKNGNVFDPQGGATRAEVATIIMRTFLKK